MSSTAPYPIDMVAQADTLKLVIPPHMGSKMKWAPQRYGPSIILTRVATLPHLQLPPPAPIVTEDANTPCTIVLTKFIGGGQFDYHAASLRREGWCEGAGGEDAGREDAGLVVLMLDLSHFPQTHLCDERERIVQQVFFYTRLASAQGRFVPRFGGLFNHGTLYALVFDDAGRRLVYSKDYKVEGIREEIIETVKGINDAGVIVGPRWWYLFNRGDDGVLRMTNFDPLGVDTIENFTPEYYARAAANGFEKAAKETPEETFARRAERYRKFMLEEMFDEYDDES